jgi:hypothetical protein
MRKGQGSYSFAPIRLLNEMFGFLALGIIDLVEGYSGCCFDWSYLGN